MTQRWLSAQKYDEKSWKDNKERVLPQEYIQSRMSTTMKQGSPENAIMNTLGTVQQTYSQCR